MPISLRAEAGLVHEQASLGICTNWSPQQVPNAPLIHYRQPIHSADGQELWAKGSYEPWRKISDPSRAQHEHGQDLLSVLNDFIEDQEEAAIAAQLAEEMAHLRQRIADLEDVKASQVREAAPAHPQLDLSQEAVVHTPETAQTIFVCIVCEGDPELPYTLDDCLRKAKYPDNLRFGICWQYDRQHPVDMDKFKHDRRFQFVEYSIEQSKSGTWARSMAQQFWNGEPYTLQIDSQMKFEPDWDVTLISMMQRLPLESGSKKSHKILSIRTETRSVP